MSLELGYLNELEIELLAKETGLSVNQIEIAQRAYSETRTISLDEPRAINDEMDETTLLGLLADEVYDPFKEAVLSERNSDLIRIMEECLKPREVKVIRMRFGFETGSPMSLQEIGTVYGVTRERIRQIEAKALTKLRRRLKRDGKSEWFVD